MTAQILPYPLTRRVHDVELLAGNMAGMTHERAERYLRERLDRATGVLAKNQLRPDHVAVQVSQLETAVRCALWRRILFRGGAA